jgi:hypothetical protein
MKRAPLGSLKAALGCGIVFIIFSGIVGIVLSFFSDDPALASMIRKRCITGIVLCILVIVAVKIVRIDAD